MEKINIYQNQSQQLLHLFEEAGSSKKVLCAPMDYAKNDHLMCYLFEIFINPAERRSRALNSLSRKVPSKQSIIAQYKQK